MAETELKDGRKKQGLHSGSRNGMWKGGIAEYPDHFLLKKNRILALKRAGGKCEICGERARLVHHVDGTKSNHEMNNLVAVCVPCHWAVHSEEKEIQSQRGTSKIIRQFGMSAKEIADHLGLTPAMVYYHLKRLTQPFSLEHKKSHEIRCKLRELLMPKVLGEKHETSHGAGDGGPAQDKPGQPLPSPERQEDPGR